MNNCPNCGSKINQGDIFCKVCGSKLPQEENNQFNNGQTNLNFNNNQQSTVINQVNNTDDGLVRAYIGKNADKLLKGNFSFCVFLFGAIYVLYRKMWLLGIIWIVINVISMMFLPTYSWIISFVINIFLMFQFKKIYIKHVHEEVAKIESENPGKSREELGSICSKKGGTTLIPIFLVILFYVVILYFLISAIMNVSDTSIGNLNVSIPKIFKLSDYSNNNLKMYDAHADDYSYSCNLTIKSSNADFLNNDAKEYLEDDIYVSDKNTFSGISEKVINNNTWYYATVKSDYGQDYYYSIMNNNIIYEVEFSINTDKDNTCSNAHKEILESLKFD